jgi:hypothetical protein
MIICFVRWCWWSSFPVVGAVNTTGNFILFNLEHRRFEIDRKFVSPIASAIHFQTAIFFIRMSQKIQLKNI